ncbi:hypothetical protein SBDP1_500013 [Syntrophobacter sp. SbD1]|nr:hypothetical protein SBDP1_500013 [Syntrophobacter sp. SbD1]
MIYQYLAEGPFIEQSFLIGIVKRAIYGFRVFRRHMNNCLKLKTDNCPAMVMVVRIKNPFA